MTPAALRDLASLVEARKARDLARLEGLIAEDRRLAAEIAGLAATASLDLASGERLPLMQQAVRQAWADQRIRAAAAAPGRAPDGDPCGPRRGDPQPRQASRAGRTGGTGRGRAAAQRGGPRGRILTSTVRRQKLNLNVS